MRARKITRPSSGLVPLKLINKNRRNPGKSPIIVNSSAFRDYRVKSLNIVYLYNIGAYNNIVTESLRNSENLSFS